MIEMWMISLKSEPTIQNAVHSVGDLILYHNKERADLWIQRGIKTCRRALFEPVEVEVRVKNEVCKKIPEERPGAAGIPEAKTGGEAGTEK